MSKEDEVKSVGGFDVSRGRESFGKMFLTVCLIYMSAFMIVSPSAAIGSAEASIKLCGETVIPSLFPFIFCSNMLVALGFARIMSASLTRVMYPIFGVSGSGAFALVMGMLSGYPVGASCTATLFDMGECSASEAERLTAFCNNSGPMFVIGVVGCKMLGSRDAGILLYAIHIISAVICGILMRFLSEFFKSDGEVVRKLPSAYADKDMKSSATDISVALTQSINTMLKICGFIILFSVFTSVIPQNGVKKYIYALLEVTGGISELAREGETLPCIAAFLSFSGVSVIMQTAAIISPKGLSLNPYILGKILQAFISYGLTSVYLKFFPLSIVTFAGELSESFYAVTPRVFIYISLYSVISGVLILGASAIIMNFFDKKRRRGH